MGRKKRFNLANAVQDENKQTTTEEIKPEVEEKKEIDFQVFGSDIILSKIDFLDYQKISNKMLFLRYHLLGQFDEKGKYYIKDDIKKDLIKVQKEIQVEDSEGYIAHLRYANLTFEFEISLTYEDEKAQAQLLLVEKIQDKTIKTLIDTFQEQNSDEFRINVRKKYNLVDVAFTIRDEEIPSINIWLYWQSEEELYWHDMYEMGAQFYVLKAIAILETYGELGAQILSQYHKLLEEGNLQNSKFSYMKEVLDSVINTFGGYEKVDDGKGKLGELAKEFSAPFFKKEESKTSIIETSRPKTKTESKNTKVEDYSWRNIDKSMQTKTTTTKKAGKKQSKSAVKKEEVKKKNVYAEPYKESKEKKEEQKQNKSSLEEVIQPQSKPNTHESFRDLNFENISGKKEIQEMKVENSEEVVGKGKEEFDSGSEVSEKI